MRPIQTRFRYGSVTLCHLALPATATRRFIMQKARRHYITVAPTACRRMFSGTISLSCSEFFSPFPHGTSSLSCSREYLALPDGPGRFTQNFSWSVLLRISLNFISIRLRGYHTLWPDAPDCSALNIACLYRDPTTPTTP
jgi:hypothetical protein